MLFRVDVLNINVPVTKWNIQVTKAEDMAKSVAASSILYRKTGKPGSVLSISQKDAQFSTNPFSYQPWHLFLVSSRTEIESRELNKPPCWSMQQDTYILGKGVILANATKELIALLKKTILCFPYSFVRFPQIIPCTLIFGIPAIMGQIKTPYVDLRSPSKRFDDRVPAM